VRNKHLHLSVVLVPFFFFFFSSIHRRYLSLLVQVFISDLLYLYHVPNLVRSTLCHFSHQSFLIIISPTPLLCISPVRTSHWPPPPASIHGCNCFRISGHTQIINPSQFPPSPSKSPSPLRRSSHSSPDSHPIPSHPHTGTSYIPPPLPCLNFPWLSSARFSISELRISVLPVGPG
jgi:hypothetical protein